MTFFGIELFAIIGFLLASYSIVANDAIQTLGTFLSSNSRRHWLVLWMYACSIIVIVMAYAYFFNDHDISYGRLNRIPYPEDGIKWWHALPPLFLLVLTRYGVPVSTTFLVLTIFAFTGGSATEGVLQGMIIKSFMGYAVALVAGGAVYCLIAGRFERWISNTPREVHSLKWTVLQWSSTAFLWSQWLVQDLANIFVFLPRQTMETADGVHVSFDPWLILFATLVMLLLHGVIFAIRGGEIQKIVLAKTNTVDVRAATVVDFIYGLILVFFKELNDIPMSTTWVFLGLLAGREIAISFVGKLRSPREAMQDITHDIIRVMIGLLVSILLALGLPTFTSGQMPQFF